MSSFAKCFDVVSMVVDEAKKKVARSIQKMLNNDISFIEKNINY